MFSYEGLMRLNAFLTGVYRMVYLTLLWLVTTLAGLIVFGLGPASYALAAYIDGWFRLGEQPPMTRTFFQKARVEFWRSAAMGWIIIVAGTIIGTNIFAASSWALRFANVVAIFLLFIASAYVFPIAVATDQKAIHRRFAAAFLAGIGSLHWTIIAAAATTGWVWLLYTYALPILPLFAMVVPATAIGLITRSVFRKLAADNEGDGDTASPAQTPQGITT
ncbi:hypothetical protein GCM10010922_18470 [Microbacterium sorbitolivorans]|uniref:DUF624 domain-containing protein n=1 Tax=Microbacterium sorbitolivorans TaxID=1867410 RepID=A0A367Y867_9MICO|nr:DUF624 domain-containing protein [Microbacterium sorbitolivorans]RCK62086.1 DUF624 domain-containing protein [Microbacterium sorbitolivorans]GGF43322.1 hypothetical protein GCM10010922_18470 [Microbacterium sorbitolivorans]